MSQTARFAIAITLLLLLGAAVWLISIRVENGTRLAFALGAGALFGIVLQRSRFCFLCNVRDFVETRDPRGVIAILLALAVGTIGYHVILATWLPNPTAGSLAPDAHIGPVGPALVIAAFAFGLGMAISGSCISGHLYRLGEGSPTAPFALLGTLLGFVVGFATWNTMYVTFIAQSPVLWLPSFLGYGTWVVIQLAALLALTVFVLTRARLPASAPLPTATTPLSAAVRSVAIDRWPQVVGGLAVGVIATAYYFRVAPLGVTAEIGSLARATAANAGVLPETLHGLDAFRGCRTSAMTSALSANGLFVIGLVIASFATALAAGQFQPERPTRDQIVRGLSGGILLGWGAMTAIGCTVGTLLSGIMVGAVSGWVFLFASLAGTLIGLAARKRASQPASA